MTPNMVTDDNTLKDSAGFKEEFNVDGNTISKCAPVTLISIKSLLCV